MSSSDGAVASETGDSASGGFDLDRFLALPRVSGLVLSPDGQRLITTVATVSPDGKRFVNALWELDPSGQRQPRRLTRSAPGEQTAAFLPEGSILFTSSRPDPALPKTADEPRDEEMAALWLLPVAGGEARLVASPPGGVDSVVVARRAGTVVFTTGLFSDAADAAADADRARARREAGVSAQLFDEYPIRWWDHYVGPRQQHIVAAAAPAGDDAPLGAPADLTPAPGTATRLVELGMDVSPDGTTVVTGWRRDGGREFQADLVAIDVASGQRRLLAAADGDHLSPACSPDGRRVAYLEHQWGSVERGPERVILWVLDLATSERRRLAADLDLDPAHPTWSPDGTAVFFVAERRGQTPVFRASADGASTTVLCADGAFTDICVSPDGSTVYALRSSPSSPPQAVALDAHAADQVPRAIPTPGLPITVPGRLEELEATASDGTPIHAWLTLPQAASARSKAPLLLCIHGGPFASWTGWHWRWNAQVLAAHGYAVLQPDPALSTGYGHHHLVRGWGDWAQVPSADLLTSLDAALQRPDVDATRVAAIGGSYGGYMANWLAGHSDRFSAIVTHASVWSMDQMFGTTDFGPWLEREFGDAYRCRDRWLAQSPHMYVDRISTPMLVIHGERDHRVPVAEALRLWTDLRLHGVPAKFLYFPDENHWILKPQNARIWYRTVLAFLDHHLRGAEWKLPELL